MALAAFDQGGEDDTLAAGVLLHDQVHDAGVGVFDHRLAGYGRIGRGGPGVEQSEEIRNLGYGAHGGAGIAVGALLLYGDGGAEAVDALHLGPFHHADVVPGVSGQGVHVAAPGLGVDGVEGQRRLAAAAQAGDDHEGMPRYPQGDTLEVVDRGLADVYVAAVLHAYAFCCRSISLAMMSSRKGLVIFSRPMSVAGP